MPIKQQQVTIQKAGLGLDKFKLAIGLQSFSTLALVLMAVSAQGFLFW